VTHSDMTRALALSCRNPFAGAPPAEMATTFNELEETMRRLASPARPDCQAPVVDSKPLVSGLAAEVTHSDHAIVRSACTSDKTSYRSAGQETLRQPASPVKLQCPIFSSTENSEPPTLLTGICGSPPYDLPANVVQAKHAGPVSEKLILGHSYPHFYTDNVINEEFVRDTKGIDMDQKDVQARFERISDVDLSCLEALRNVVDYCDPKEWTKMMLIDGEEVIESVRCVCVQGMPSTSVGDALIGHGSVILTKRQASDDISHRLHFLMASDSAQFSGCEKWGNRASTCFGGNSTSYYAKYESQRRCSMTASSVNIKGNLFHANATIEDTATAVSELIGGASSGLNCWLITVLLLWLFITLCLVTNYIMNAPDHDSLLLLIAWVIGSVMLVFVVYLHKRRQHEFFVQVRLRMDGKDYINWSQESEERRIARNGKAYTYAEFQKYYGEDADVKWANAASHDHADEVDVEVGQGAYDCSKPRQGKASHWPFVAFFLFWCLIMLGFTLNHSSEKNIVTQLVLPWTLWSGAIVFLVMLYSSATSRINHWYAKAAHEIRLQDQLQAVLHEGSKEARQKFPDTIETSVKADQAVVVKMVRTIHADYHDSSSQKIRRAHIILDPAESVRKGLKLSSELASLCSPAGSITQRRCRR